MNANAGPLKILVVDDDSFVRDLLCEILKSKGHLVDSAADGKEAAGMIDAAEGLDLVISDMDMPVMTGLELIHHLREKGCEIPVIILTGNGEIRTAIEALKKGANDYLLKDENIEDTVVVSIDNAMELHRLKMENVRLLDDLARKNRELERLSLLDPLTDIANRRYFDKVIEQEWGRAGRNEKSLSVIMVDIDYFKLYNDTYGHQKGDDCLHQVAGALNSSLRRDADCIARYGGEEFVAILPDTEIEGAKEIATAMCTLVVGLNITHSASGVSSRVTVSVGAACTIPGRQSTYSKLIKEADRALYAAKEGGRNRVETRILS